MDLVTLEGVTKSFGAMRAVDHFSLTVRQGEILGFLGTNGAGKTTTIKMLLGFCRPDSAVLSFWVAVQMRLPRVAELATCPRPLITIHS